MFSIQQILTLFLTLTMELNLTACGAEGATQPIPEMPEPPAQVQETLEPVSVPSSEPELKVTEAEICLRKTRRLWTGCLSSNVTI